MKELFIPCLVSLLVLLAYLSYRLKGSLERPALVSADKKPVPIRTFESNVMLGLGTGMLLFVPVFKTVTHLPLYLGMLLALGVMWLVSEILHSGKDDEAKEPLTAAYALTRIDTPSILFSWAFSSPSVPSKPPACFTTSPTASTGASATRTSSWW